MNHSFNVEVARRYGVNAAVMLEAIYWWVENNAANERNLYEGRYWTYNSVSAFERQFPYLTAKQIRSTLATLEDEGLVESGVFNNMPFDRTKWYTLTAKGYGCLLEGQTADGGRDAPGAARPDGEADRSAPEGKSTRPRGQMTSAPEGKSSAPEGKSELPQGANENCPGGQTNTSYIPVNNQLCSGAACDAPQGEGTGVPRFRKPTREEVAAYCAQRDNSVDPDRFCDHYETVGWRVGRSPMKDWKAAVRNWERNDTRFSERRRGGGPVAGSADFSKYDRAARAFGA